MLRVTWAATAAVALGAGLATIAAMAQPDQATSLSGVPIGGIGCGAIEVFSDGSFGGVTINNNSSHPVRDLKGAFCTIWTSAAGKVQSRMLQAKGEFGLQGASKITFSARPPLAELTFPDANLPVEATMTVFNPLVPTDRKSSSLPAALIVISLKNVSRAPVDAAVALSFPALLGVGGSLERGPFADRTGNTVSAAPSQDGIFGMRMASPALPATALPDRMRYNARGDYALLCQPSEPDVTVSSASWNALEPSPAWLENWNRTGTLTGTVSPGSEGKVHPAAVVAMKASLGAAQTRQFAFCISWYTPRNYLTDNREVGHFYELSFDSAVEVGRFALANRLSLKSLTEEWQRRIARSSLPQWIGRRILDDIAALGSRTRLSRDAGLPSPESGLPQFGLATGSTLDNPLQRAGVSPILSMISPTFQRESLTQIAERVSNEGQLPEGVEVGVEEAANSHSTPRKELRAAALWLWQCHRFVTGSGDGRFLDTVYPSCKRVMTRLLKDNLEAEPAVRLLCWRLMGDLAERIEDKQLARECVLQSVRIANSRKPDSIENLAVAALLSRTAGLADLPSAEMPDTPNRRPEPSRFSLAGWKASDWPISFAGPAQLALLIDREGVDTATSSVERILKEAEQTASSPWRIPWTGIEPSLRAADSDPGGSGAWLMNELLSGVSVDQHRRTLIVKPNLLIKLTSAEYSVFSPTLWAWVTLRRSKDRAVISFQFDRFIPEAAPTIKIQPAPTDAGLTAPRGGLVIDKILLPTITGLQGEVKASIGRSPVPGTIVSRVGEREFIPSSPITLRIGDRLQFELR